MEAENKSTLLHVVTLGNERLGWPRQSASRDTMHMLQTSRAHMITSSIDLDILQMTAGNGVRHNCVVDLGPFNLLATTIEFFVCHSSADIPNWGNAAYQSRK